MARRQGRAPRGGRRRRQPLTGPERRAARRRRARKQRTIRGLPKSSAPSGIVGVQGSRQSMYQMDHGLKLPEKQRQPGQPKGIGGAAKRRRRKGGNPQGGPGHGGIQGSLKRLKKVVETGDPSHRGHIIGKGVA
jgi:hypothetical protein